MEGLAVPLDAIKSGLVSVGHFIVDGLSAALTTVKDGIVGALSFITDKLSFVIDGLISVVNSIADGVSSVVSAILGIPLAIIGFLKDLLVELFVPSGDFLGDFKEILEEKIPFIAQLITLMSNFLDIGNDAKAPNFDFTYKDTTVSIVDFNSFSAFLPIIHSIIIAVCYFGYFFKLFKRLPALIHGFTPL